MSSDHEGHKRIRELESKVAFLLEHLGLAYEPGPEDMAPPEVIDLVRQGNKIEAIRVLREAADVSLKEAKDIVDEIDRQYQSDSL